MSRLRFILGLLPLRKLLEEGDCSSCSSHGEGAISSVSRLPVIKQNYFGYQQASHLVAKRVCLLVPNEKSQDLLGLRDCPKPLFAPGRTGRILAGDPQTAHHHPCRCSCSIYSRFCPQENQRFLLLHEQTNTLLNCNTKYVLHVKCS